MNGVWVCRRSDARRGPGRRRPGGREVTVTIDLKAGDARATVWTNDLTHAYVHENSAYSQLRADDAPMTHPRAPSAGRPRSGSRRPPRPPRSPGPCRG